jgi:hypothetical protein
VKNSTDMTKKPQQDKNRNVESYLTSDKQLKQPNLNRDMSAEVARVSNQRKNGANGK